jgi:cytoskeleton protein RodZ
MSEVLEGYTESETPAGDDVSAGTLLRRAREAAGLHVAALAVSLKVPVRKLEALEEDRFDMMSDAVFVRGLASSVCRTLKIDPQPVLDRLPRSTAPRLPQNSDGLNTPFRAPSDGAPPGWIDYVRQPVFLAVFALLLGALVLILLPSAKKDDRPAQLATAAQPSPAIETVQPKQATTEPTVAATPVQTDSPAPAASAVAATVVSPAVKPGIAPPSGAPASAPVAAPKLTAAAAPASAPVAAAAPLASGVVVMRAKGETWVEVTDAKGIVALRKTLAAGQSAGASGVLPLQVTIGRVDMTDVLVRGKPFDMRRVSRDNVARFEVK